MSTSCASNSIPDLPVSSDSPPPGELKTTELLLGRLRADQFEEAAKVIHQSLCSYYGRHLNQGGRFGDDWRPFLVFPELYETLDPGCAVTACGPDGSLWGVCFYHPRETHVSIGIVSTSPAAGGKGVAKAMVSEALRIADEAGLPARLVSSALNLDSFSLYTRLGFVPGQLFQDMQFPPGKLPPPPALTGIRAATPEDAAAMADLEAALVGIRRQKDYHFFLNEQTGSGWTTLLRVDEAGKLTGFLCSFENGGSVLIGPGVTADEPTALALVSAHLHRHPTAAPVFLVPAQCRWLIASLYAAGARNVELHLAQLRPVSNCSAAGMPLPCPVPQAVPGVVIFPTFLPESG